ncbi:hypothetical protein [Deinococcus peraridilitoris]|uniref:Uncharacterized protein n=1 Tax=Deinococcus peraridilitoris (strain DSM 19664 / LMG 22246 / CIP 109416 / KR-200) TaxID=937777 RepID=L0A500_DEIPD|nr:hypothetical protein [Deinococcus peraridilitoris]AFZ68085.1 hypothetical protein Deipe_2620 [Deinococcus peraridilitoris DSM 19664]
MVKRANVEFRKPPPDPAWFLLARDVRGNWQGCSPDEAPYAATFRTLHERTGCIVTRHSARELSAMIKPKPRAA